MQLFRTNAPYRLEIVKEEKPKELQESRASQKKCRQVCGPRGSDGAHSFAGNGRERCRSQGGGKDLKGLFLRTVRGNSTHLETVEGGNLLVRRVKKKNTGEHLSLYVARNQI